MTNHGHVDPLHRPFFEHLKDSLPGGEAAIPEMFQRNGFSDAQRTALCDRTRNQLERSKVFLSLLDG